MGTRNPILLIKAPIVLQRAHEIGRDGCETAGDCRINPESLCYQPKALLNHKLGFGVPYFNTFLLKGTIMKYKFILYSPWLLKSPVKPKP